jgi:hypothetical protein
MNDHARHLRAVDAHFAGRASRAGEAAMRAHLPGCERCRRRYDRHLLLARLDTRALPAEERLARGLGIVPRPKRAGLALSVGVLAVAAVALLVGVPRDEAPQLRGAGPQPTLLIYRVAPDGRVEPVAGRIGAADELAFAYGNPGGRRYLLVYGEDEHGHVYWFHPGWPVGAPAPAAVEARPGAGPHELPEAVRHRFDGRRLRINAVLSDERMGVGTIERHALSSPPMEDGRAQIVSRTLEVVR